MKAIILTDESHYHLFGWLRRKVVKGDYKIARRLEDLFGYRDTILLIGKVPHEINMEHVRQYCQEHDIEVFYVEQHS